MSKDANEVSSVAQNSCPLCGGDSFTWGVARGAYPMTFKPDKASWLVKQFIVGQKIKARRCASCGNIQLFVAPE